MKIRWMLGTLGLVVALGLTTQADAVLQMQLTSGTGATGIITDQGAGDINPAVGVITFSGPVGVNFTVNVTTGVTFNPIPEMDLNSIDLDTAGPDTLLIALTDTSFPATSPGVLVSDVGGTVDGPATVAFQSWKNPDNLPFSTAGVTAGVMGPFAGGAFSATSAAPHGAFGPYSMTIEALIVATGPSHVSFNIDVKNTVPEPATLALLGTGLVALGTFCRRRKNS